MAWLAACTLATWLSFCALATLPAFAQQPLFDGDPDTDVPTLHVQPPALGVPSAQSFAAPFFGTVDGVEFIDVLMASGYDLAMEDRGNEPSLAVNPLDPNQIVLTSFAGSSWGSGGNSSIFYSADGGHTWVHALAVPPPHAPTNLNCPCDQTMDWGRDGVLSATFLWFGFALHPQTVYSAQTTSPLSPSAWVYRTEASTHSQPTSGAGLEYVDQPWIAGGPLPWDNSKISVSVAYDNFDSSFGFAEMRAAASHDATPLDFSLDAPVNDDGLIEGDGMNPGHRIAVGANGLIFDLYQRWNFNATDGVKSITYLLSVSSDGGATWSVANSDHPTGAKIVATGLSFQGSGSKVGGVNALLGGITAITTDPSTGSAWIVYGTRAAVSSFDRLFLVSATYDAGSLILGTPRQISPDQINAYLPGVAVLPNGEVGVLFLTWDGVRFGYRIVQTIDGGATLLKTTTLASFLSPFASNPGVSQRIFGDYLQLRAAGCAFYGTYPARGLGPNSSSSIDPYFVKAPAASPCALPTLTGLSTRAVCAGGPGFTEVLMGTGLASAGNGRSRGALRPTIFVSPAEVHMSVPASDIASPGTLPIDYLGPSPAGGLTAAQALAVEPPAESPGSSLRLTKNGSSIRLGWGESLYATSYNVRRCLATAPCVPATVATLEAGVYAERFADGLPYWYQVDAVNSCGAVP